MFHILIAFGVVCVVNFVQSTTCEVLSYFVVLIWIFLMTCDVEHVFISLFAICVFFGEVSVQVFGSTFNSCVCV